jgi:hypothetical protein
MEDTAGTKSLVGAESKGLDARAGVDAGGGGRPKIDGDFNLF